MFERFTADARRVVVEAQEEARRLHHGRIGTEHLLLALLEEDSPTAAVLVRHGLTRTPSRIVGQVSSTTARRGRHGASGSTSTPSARRWRPPSGPGRSTAPRPGRRQGATSRSAAGQEGLELSLREALALKYKMISDGHIALGMSPRARGWR